MIKVVTETGGNIPRALVDELGISVVSGDMIFGDERILEYPDLSAAEFYRRLAASDKLPVGRDPMILDFKKVYSQLVAETPRATILSVHISEALGTALNTARQTAALMPTADIRLFDTGMVSFGEGLMVCEAARMARNGASADAILTRLIDMRSRVQLYVVVDTLEYLAKGGRVGPVARLVGGLLDMKPILTIRDGMVQSFARHRTRARAIEELHTLALEGCQGARGVRIGVMHAVCEDDARRLADELRARLQPDELSVVEIGPAVGMHTGPGALGVCWYVPPKNV